MIKPVGNATKNLLPLISIPGIPERALEPVKKATIEAPVVTANCIGIP